MSHQAPQSDRPSKFVVGRTYATRSICDHDCIIQITVIGRTAKTLRVQTNRGLQTLRVSEYRGIEQVKPWGSYSMAPIVGADDEQPMSVAEAA